MPAEDQMTRLLSLVVSLGLEEDALDDAVYDCAQEESLGSLNAEEDPEEQETIIGESESRASEINNGGFESQIEYLLENSGYEETERLLRAAADAEMD